MRIIELQYTHKLMCRYGIIWYDAPGRLWTSRLFLQCRCRKEDEAEELETAITVRQGDSQCVDFPVLAAEHERAVQRARLNAHPVIQLNDEPDSLWNKRADNPTSDFQLEIKDETTHVSRRSSKSSMVWENVDFQHKMVACARADEFDIVLRVGIFDLASIHG